MHNHLKGKLHKCSVWKGLHGGEAISRGVLYSILVETKRIGNCRPLTYLYDEIKCEPLTPNQLPFGRKLPTLDRNSSDLVDDTPAHTKRFWYLVQRLDHFRSRWKHKYLADLREFHKSKTTREVQVQKGDTVLVMEDSYKKHQW